MKIYKITVQFANPSAPDFSLPDVKEAIERSIDNYNLKSVLAKNPKKILKHYYNDNRTLLLILQSENELPIPGKALRLFTSYLINPNTIGALNEYIYGKQLFKMSYEEMDSYESSITPMQSSACDSLKLQAISMILTASESTITNVLKVLKEGKNEY